MKWIVIAVLFIPGVLWGQVNYVTNFPTTENPIAEGSPVRWQNTQGTLTSCTNGGNPCWWNVKTVSGVAESTATTAATGFDDATAILANPVTGGTWGANQAVWGIAKAPTTFCTTQCNTQELELRLRVTIGSNFIHGYEVDYTHGGGVFVVRWDGTGPFSSTGNCTGTSWCTLNGGAAISGYTWSNGDVLMATISGTNPVSISVFQANAATPTSFTLLGTVTDSSSFRYTTGNPGIGVDVNSGTVTAGSNFTNFGFSKFEATDQTIVQASDCTETNVNTAITNAVVGSIVNVPAGTCTWATAFTLDKAITLEGNGQGSTNITMGVVGSGGANPILKQTTGVTRIRDFTFSVSGPGGDLSAAEVFLGDVHAATHWQNTYPVIFQYDTFNITGACMFRLKPPGGFIFSHVTMSGSSINAGTNADEGIAINNNQDTDGSWSNPDTFGTKDTATTLTGTIANTSGFLNTYIEDSTFNNLVTITTDVDDGGRVVVRHNTFTDAELNSHGEGTSPFGLRHWEYYNNNFLNTASEGGACSAQSNMQNDIWLRGGTGVIYNNTSDNLNTSCWGNKSEVSLSVDTNNTGGCPASGSSYPLPHQLGQGFTTTQVTEPIFLWNNTVNAGTGVSPFTFDVAINWFYGCATPITGYMQSGRDYVNDSTLASKPTSTGTWVDNYNAYPYPHTLVGGSAPATAPAFSLTPASFSFGSITVGNSSAVQGFTLTNTGTASATLSSIGLSGTNPGDFSQSNTCGTLPVTLAVNASCTVNVTFTPVASGSRSATLTATDTPDAISASSTLTGTGLSGTPQATFSPTSFNFGSLVVGNSGSAIITLSNPGTATLSINSLSITGTNASDFSQSNNCGASLNQSSSCNITVVFQPRGIGSRAASVSVSDNASGSPQTATMSGTGTAASIMKGITFQGVEVQ